MTYDIENKWTIRTLTKIMKIFWCRFEWDLCKKQPHQTKESTTSAIVVEESTTSPQPNWRSSNTCDITSSSITTIDSTNRRKLTHMWYHQWYHLWYHLISQVVSPVISHVICDHMWYQKFPRKHLGIKWRCLLMNQWRERLLNQWRERLLKNKSK